MPRSHVVLVFVAAIAAVFAAPADAGHRHHRHHAGPAYCADGSCVAPVCQPQTVTKTIMVPHTEYRTMTVRHTVCKPVVHQKTVPVTCMIPETAVVTRTVPIVRPEARVKTVTYQVCHMNYEVVNETITVQVPHTEMRQGTRTICRPVTETVMRTVCQHTGHYAARTYTDCDGCVHTCHVWVPQIVTRQVPVAVTRPEYVEVPFEYPVIVCRPEERVITRHIPRQTYETKTRDVHYLVAVTHYVEKQFPKTVFRPVTQEKIVSYTEFVPEQVERLVTVPVCTMVPKTVTYTLGCGHCAACGH